MECIICGCDVGLGERAVVMPFPAAGEECYLVVHHECCPEAEKIETNMVGYFLQGSGKFFVPRELVGHLEPTEGEGESGG